MDKVIEFPKRINEAEVKQFLYKALEKQFRGCKGIDIRIEVPAKDENGRVFFDLVVFDHKDPLVVIETKKRKKLKCKEQDNRYMAFGYPFINCYNKSMIKYTVRQIWYHYNKTGSKVLKPI